MKLKLEKVTERDLPELTKMLIKLWPECQYEEEYDNALKIISDDNQEIFLAKSADMSIGFVQLSLRSEFVEGTTSTPVAYIEGLYVEPEYRRKSVANQLVKMAERWGLEKNCTEIASDAELANLTSIDFHKAYGFKEMNRIVCFAKKINKD